MDLAAQAAGDELRVERPIERLVLLLERVAVVEFGSFRIDTQRTFVSPRVWTRSWRTSAKRPIQIAGFDFPVATLWYAITTDAPDSFASSTMFSNDSRF